MYFTAYLKGTICSLSCSSPTERQIISCPVTRGTSITSPNLTAGPQCRARLFVLQWEVAKAPIYHMPLPFVSCMWSLMNNVLLPSSEAHSYALSPTTCHTQAVQDTTEIGLFQCFIAQELEQNTFPSSCTPCLCCNQEGGIWCSPLKTNGMPLILQSSTWVLKRKTTSEEARAVLSPRFNPLSYQQVPIAILMAAGPWTNLEEAWHWAEVLPGQFRTPHLYMGRKSLQTPG